MPQGPSLEEQTSCVDQAVNRIDNDTMSKIEHRELEDPPAGMPSEGLGVTIGTPRGREKIYRGDGMGLSTIMVMYMRQS